jgi:hypothetical protein
MKHTITLALVLAACSAPAWSQAVKPALQTIQYALAPSQHGTVRVVPLSLAGEYAGNLGPLHIKLHLRVTNQGELAGTLDGDDVTGIKVDNFATAQSLEGYTLSFRIPTLPAFWTGEVGADGTLRGAWRQGGNTQPLKLVRR